MIVDTMRSVIVGALAFVTLGQLPTAEAAPPPPPCPDVMDTGIAYYQVNNAPLRVGKPLKLTVQGGLFQPSVRDPITFKVGGYYTFHPVLGPPTSAVKVTVPPPRHTGPLRITGTWVMDFGGGVPICTQSLTGTEKVLPAIRRRNKHHARRPAFAGSFVLSRPGGARAAHTTRDAGRTTVARPPSGERGIRTLVRP